MYISGHEKGRVSIRRDEKIIFDRRDKRGSWQTLGYEPRFILKDSPHIKYQSKALSEISVILWVTHHIIDMKLQDPQNPEK